MLTASHERRTSLGCSAERWCRFVVLLRDPVVVPPAGDDSAEPPLVGRLHQLADQLRAGDVADRRPCSQAAMPRPMSRWLFPVPLAT